MRVEVTVEPTASSAGLRRTVVRSVRITGRVVGAARGSVNLHLRKDSGRRLATRRLRVSAHGRFSHVRRLRGGSYQLRASYVQASGAAAQRRFAVR
jgi:hypothetical protein